MAVIEFGSDIDLGKGTLRNFLIQNYTTLGRPSSSGWVGINIGYTYWDIDLLKIVTWDGANWQTGGTNLSGDGVSTNEGVLTIQPNVITNTKLAQAPAHTFKGNNTGALGNVIDLTATQLTAEIDVFTSTLKGVVPPSGGGTANFLRADGSWTPAGLGDMVLNAVQTNSGIKTFLNGTLALRNVANTFSSVFKNQNTAAREYTLQDQTGTVAFLSDIAAAVVGGMVNKGAYNASTNSPMLDSTPIAGIKNGWTYTVNVAGIFFSQEVQVGDVLISNVDNPTLEANWTILNKNIPDILNAAEGVIGVLSLATQAEVITGTNDTKAITPLKLRTELSSGLWVYTAPAFGNGVIKTFAFTHGLIGGSLNPTVIIKDTVSKALVYTQVVVTSSTVVTIDFNTAPTSNQYTVVIKK